MTHPSQRRGFLLKRLSEDPELKLGKMKWFDSKKGYGFVCPFEGYGDKEVFVYRRQLKLAPGVLTVAEGTFVEYKLKVLDTKDKDGNEKTNAEEVTGPGGALLGVAPGPPGMLRLGAGPAFAHQFPPGRRQPMIPLRGAPLIGGAPRAGRRLLAAHRAPQRRPVQFPPQRRAPPIAGPGPLMTLGPRGRPGVHPQVLAAHARTAVLGKRGAYPPPQAYQPVAAPRVGLQSGGYGILRQPGAYQQPRRYY